MNEPELHGRFSIHPESVRSCRAILEWAEIDHEQMSDWEAVKCVETTHRFAVGMTKGFQLLGLAAMGATARMGEMLESLVEMAAQEAVHEAERITERD